MAVSLALILARVTMPFTSTSTPTSKAAVNGGDGTARRWVGSLGGCPEVSVDLHHLGKGGMSLSVQEHPCFHRGKGGAYNAALEVVNLLLLGELHDAKIFE
jgi:hypothetical protein